MFGLAKFEKFPRWMVYTSTAGNVSGNTGSRELVFCLGSVYTTAVTAVILI